MILPSVLLILLFVFIKYSYCQDNETIEYYDNIEPRIRGGGTGRIHQVQSTLAIYAGRRDSRMYYRCSGVIIDSWFALTAANCINTNLVYTALAGRHIVKSYYGWDSRYEFSQGFCPIQGIYVHEDYDPKINDNDIAILKSLRRFRLHTTIKAALIDDKVDKSSTYVSGFIAAYGESHNEVKFKFKADRTQDFGSQSLNIAQMTFDTDEKYIHKDFNKSKHFSAYAQNGGPCESDVGGPFFVDKEGNTVLYGVFSSIYSDPDSECYAGTFMRITYFHRWVKDKIYCWKTLYT